MQLLTITKMGNSAGVRIPKEVMSQAGLHLGDTLLVELVLGELSMKKVIKPKRYQYENIKASFDVPFDSDDYGEYDI